MASFLKRVSTSCFITRACSGPTRVGNTPLNRGGRDPNWILYPLSTVCRTLWDTFGRNFHAARKCIKGTVSRDWLLVCFELLAWCPEAEDWQGTANLDVLNTFLEVASLSGPLRFRAEAERKTHWRSLCPEALGVAGVTERSLEVTEERRAPYTEVCTTHLQRGLPSDVLGRKRQDLLTEAFLLKMTVLRSVTSLEDFDLALREDAPTG